MITFLQHHLQPHKGASYRERGMTLIEVVIAIAIMGVIVGAVYEFLIFANRETYAADTKEEIVEEVNLFFLRVSQDIRNAKKCEILDSNHTLELSGGQIIYKWYEDNEEKKGVKRNGIPVMEMESKNITDVKFNRVDDNKINIVVEAKIVVAGGREQEQTFSTVVTCRN
ncbi:MAG TPA: prepilin-type N-terminal cleavage/methylation domain-containing protein [Candidatus Atribacteria bacterium]|nr:prepilin-type N-terminal cleavage/methylation domain-containing protein [Candidatus Atribacteria bacterium]HQE25208.1 prepilin-type N-terminal cleavage/methylation domain-containing protein [Candidatus Atribacteria bacterium]